MEVTSASLSESSLQIVEFSKAANSRRGLKAGKGTECGRIQAKKQFELSVLWDRKSLTLMPEKKGKW